MIRALRFLISEHRHHKWCRANICKGRHYHYAADGFVLIGYRCTVCNKWGPVRGEY